MAVIEKTHEQHERGERRDRDPVQNRMRGAEHEIGGRAVPGSHLDIHNAHPDGRRSRASEGDPVVNTAQTMAAGLNTQYNTQPTPRVTIPSKNMKMAASTMGTAMMTASMMKAITRRGSTPSKSSGLRSGSNACGRSNVSPSRLASSSAILAFRFVGPLAVPAPIPRRQGGRRHVAGSTPMHAALHRIRRCLGRRQGGAWTPIGWTVRPERSEDAS